MERLSNWLELPYDQVVEIGRKIAIQPLRGEIRLAALENIGASCVLSRGALRLNRIAHLLTLISYQNSALKANSRPLTPLAIPLLAKRNDAACGHSRKPVQYSADRGWVPSATTRVPDTALCQFCRDLPQRRTAGYQIGKHRMELLSTLNRCGLAC